MTDVIWGDVVKVIDGDTFDIKVTHVSRGNQYEYKDHERIRIEEIDAPELPSPAGKRAKQDLEHAIIGKFVRCDIRTRDTYRRLICKGLMIQKMRI
ncbi:MAG: hypothetical protein H8D26_02760 [Methanomicrobia archaeon]|nr:hypothetical protein [Methanomicrobia archaeon]